MNILAWNVNHRSRERQVPSTMAAAVASLRPDVVALTEYVPGAGHRRFIGELADVGLRYALWTDRVVGQNSLLIAARTPLIRGAWRPTTGDAAFPSNVLHAILPDDGVSVLGVRIPDYSRQPALKRACWDWVQLAADSLRTGPGVIVGDFNTDPSYSPARCGDRIARLVESGWTHVRPAAGASYHGPNGASVCIDHAFVSPGIGAAEARYVIDHGAFAFAGKQGGALSDHAALLVTVCPRPA